VSLVEPFLHADDFYRDAHRTLYEAIIHLYLRREPADFLTICNELERCNKLAAVGGASYITSLINRDPTSANGEYYGRIVAQRLMALEARLDLARLWKRALTEEERIRLIEVSGTIMDAPILIDDTPAMTLTALRSKICRALTTGDLDLIIVDYLQKLVATTESGKRYADRVQEVSEIARGLKDIAREFHLPVLALAQLSLAAESRAEKVPQLSDLRDSGELEQEADLVLFLYRDEYYAGYAPDGSSRSTRPGSADLICAKHRNGPLGELRLGFAANQTRFYSQESK
jgi:replicative DNA helicase